MLGFCHDWGESGIRAGMTIDVDQIIARLHWAAARGLTAYEEQRAGVRLSLRRKAGDSGGARPAGAVAAPDMPADMPPEMPPDAAVVTAPLAGLCQLSTAPGAAPFAVTGSPVTAGQTLCLIEAMKVMTSVTAPEAGVIEAVLVSDGAMVEAGTPLFRMRA